MRIPSKLQPWFDARQRFRLGHTHIQMARELGLKPRKFGRWLTSSRNDGSDLSRNLSRTVIANTWGARKSPLARFAPGLAYHYPKQRTPDLEVDGEIHGDVALDLRLRKGALPNLRWKATRTILEVVIGRSSELQKADRIAFN